MSQQQGSWNNLLQSWNENDAEIDKKVLSEKTLIDQINKQNRKNKREAILSGIVSIALISYIISEMYSGLPSIVDTILYSVFLVLGLSTGLYTFALARSSIVASTDSSKNHINVLLEQSKNNLKALLFSRIVCVIVFLIALFLLGMIVYVALNKTLGFQHYLVGGIALGCCLLFVGISIWFKKERIQLEQQLEFLTKLEHT
jgi:hypothetical protein